MSDMKIYARLDESNNVIEYPVYSMQIKNRNHPIEWYTECVIQETGIKPRFHYYKEILQVRIDATGKKVYVKYELMEQDLNNLLRSIIKIANNTATTPLLTDLDKETIDRIIYLADKYVENKLNDFAAIKGYSSAERAVGYINSSIPKFSNEGKRVSDIRDQVWISLPIYIGKVLTGELPIPSSTADIDNVLPEFTWD
jgi:hypothetical protein